MYPYPVFLGIGLYEICIAAGVLLAFILADRIAIKCGFSLKLQRFFVLALPLSIVIGFLGATVFQSFYNFLQTGVFEWRGMTFYGGLIFGVAAFLIAWFLVGGKIFKDGEAKKHFGDVADMAAFLIPLAHAFGRVGCFFAGCCHGQPTDEWYGVTMWTGTEWQKMVPVQLFEAAFLLLLSATVFALLFRFKIKRTEKEKETGKRVPLLAVYAVAYGVWRFFIEYARGDERGATIVSFLSPSQLTAIVLILVGIIYFCICFFRKPRTEKRENDGKS